jgi:hypothetical protein
MAWQCPTIGPMAHVLVACVVFCMTLYGQCPAFDIRAANPRRTHHQTHAYDVNTLHLEPMRTHDAMVLHRSRDFLDCWSPLAFRLAEGLLLVCPIQRRVEPTAIGSAPCETPARHMHLDTVAAATHNACVSSGFMHTARPLLRRPVGNA